MAITHGVAPALCGVVPLTQGKFAVVSPEDYRRVTQYRWYAQWSGRAWYAARKPRTGLVLMHRFIFRAGPGLDVDHVNLNTLDNTRPNLRLCPRSANLQNSKSKAGTSRYKGVHRITNRNASRIRWQAQIRVGMKRIHLGYFDTQEDAAQAYDKAARAYCGKFARLNFPGSGERSAL